MILFRRQLTSRALRYCRLRKGLAHESAGKDNQGYEVDDGRHIVELGIPRNSRKLFNDQLTSFKKKWVTDEEMLKLSANTRQYNKNYVQDLEKIYDNLKQKLEEKDNRLRQLKEENEEHVNDHNDVRFADLLSKMKKEFYLVEHKIMPYKLEKICDVKTALEYIWDLYYAISYVLLLFTIDFSQKDSSR